MNSSTPVPAIKCEEASPLNEVGPDGEGLSLSVNLSAAMIHLLAGDGGAAGTLRTPEIVNDVITMTNPLEQYAMENHPNYKGGSGNDSNSSMSSSAATSPAGGPPSIQKTCSELIKAGLKLSIESKRKMSGSDTDAGSGFKRCKREDSDEDYDSSHTQHSKNEGLTPEDEERRRRRRERNKIAATKCRMKKRERTVNLVTESEVLETQNIDLKAQLKDLEVQKRQLVDMLSMHASTCLKVKNQQGQFGLRTYEANSTFPSFEPSPPYLRPESANILASSYTCITPLNGDSSIDTISLEGGYMQPQMLEEYHRPDSVLSLPPEGFVTSDGFMPKGNLLVPMEQEQEQEYYEGEGYALSQCHTYPANADSQPKINSLNDGCLV